MGATSNKATEFSCDKNYSVSVEIWNDNSSKNLIGEPEDARGGYLMAKTWNNDEEPYIPKRFDVLIEIGNNYFAYQDSEYYDTSTWNINLKMNVISGETKNGEFILNANKSKAIELLKPKHFSIKNFSTKKPTLDYKIENIDLKKIYDRYQAKALWIDQLIFEADLSNNGSVCKYTYYFPLGLNDESE